MPYLTLTLKFVSYSLTRIVDDPDKILSNKSQKLPPSVVINSVALKIFQIPIGPLGKSLSLVKLKIEQSSFSEYELH